MTDSLARGLLDVGNLRVLTGVFTVAAREGAQRHAMAPAAATLFAQAMTGAALVAGLQKGQTRVNLQLECDGPLRGLFVDASTSGEVRGYVKNPQFDISLGDGEFQWRAALGNSGFISVLRDVGGEYYRSSVEMRAMRIGEDLNHYFEKSDQIPTHAAIAVVPDLDQPLGQVAGALVQLLPDGDEVALKMLAGPLEQRLREALMAGRPDAEGLLTTLFPEASALGSQAVRYGCSCSHARAMDAIAALGVDEVQSIVDTMGSTAVTCQFCGARHEISLKDLFTILELLGRPQNRN